MLTVRPQKSLRHAKDYFREHLLQGDYHSEKQSVAGEWFGKGAERLGLSRSDPVSEQAFVRLCENRHPLTGDKLTVRQRKDRRVFYDFVISAPKSVSILGITLRDQRLVAAHDAACRDAICELEKAAGSRIRKKGQRSTRRTGEIVAAAFRHDCSRALDPQMHTHLVTYNATWDETESRWKALEPEHMFAQTNYLTEVYRNSLAMRLRRIGYKLQPARHGFEIEGVGKEIIERFSKRSRVIREAEATVARKLGRPLTNDGRAALAHSTRERKRRNTTPGELVALQLEQLSDRELLQLRGLVRDASPPERISELSPAELAVTAVASAREHVFERLSVVPEHELLRHALAFSRGETPLDQLRDAIEREAEFIRKENMITTRAALALERKLVALVNEAVGTHAKLCPSHNLSPRLTDEQRQAVQSILGSRDGVVCLRGGAGTGKTTALKEIAASLGTEKRPVALFAPTSGAVEVLREEGFKQVDTLQRLLVDQQMQEDLRGRAIIVDEAGLLSVAQLHSLVSIGRKEGYRIILSGDSRQHSSVEAGDGLRLLEEHSQIQTVALRSIRRQVTLEYRQAIADVAAGQGLRGLSRLEKLGAIHVCKHEARYQKLAKDYLVSIQSNKSAIIVSPTWREIHSINGALRAALKEDGQLEGKPASLQVVRSERWTAAQRAELSQYGKDHVLVFHRDTRDFKKGEVATVLTSTASSLVVAGKRGKRVKLTGKQRDCYDVGTMLPLEVLPGEKLLIQGNHKDANLLNGQIVTVDRVNKDGSVRLTDGRVVPAQFKQLTYGYCVTSPASQGMTCDHVYVAMDAASGPAANRKQFYVSASRGREQIKIYTDDLDSLFKAVQKTGDRTLASELLGPRRSIDQAESRSPKAKVRV
ncbi:MAG: relaxase domain-containing protein [Verrucomicrobiales bacterium]|nr:relaxase domain-containing protein [Verrucomicrobiales bacterium]